MDISNVPNELNDPKDIILLSTFATNHAESSNNPPEPPIVRYPNRENPQRRGPETENMHKAITFIVLALFSLVVIYSLLMQNWWLVGILAIPVIRKAMFKIFERHL